LNELFEETISNLNQRSRKKCFVVYLRKKGFQRQEVAKMAMIDENSITNYMNKERV